MSKPVRMTMIFHEDNSIDCQLSSIQGVSPRMIHDGYNMLLKRYREMVGQERVKIESGQRQASIDADVQKEKDAKAFDKKESARLKKNAGTAEARHKKFAASVAV